MIEKQEYVEALDLLHSVPDPYRDKDIQQLMEVCGNRTSEVTQLRQKIKSDFHKKRFLGVLQNIDRLLTIVPDDVKLRTKAEQIRDWVYKSSLVKSERQEYEDALNNLDRIPEFLFDEKVEKLRCAIVEQRCLRREVEQSPFATKTLLGFALRLAKNTNSNGSILARCEEIKTRLQAKPKELYSIHPQWASPPEKPFVGLAVEQYCIPQSFEKSDDFNDNSLRENSAEFFVAIGLALQAIESAALQVNVLRQQSKGLLGRLSLGKRSPKAAWGIDLGTSALHAVRMIRDKSGGVLLDRCVKVLHSKSLDRQDVKDKQSEVQAATIRTFLELHEVQKESICVSMPGRRLLGRFLELPQMPAKKLTQAVGFEAQHQFPFPLDQLAWNYHLFEPDSASDEKDDTSQNALLLGAREYDVSSVLNLWKEAGVKVQQVQCDCVAMHNFIQHEFFGTNRWRTLPDSTADHDAVAVVDVGAASTNVVVSSPNRLWFRSLGIGASQFSESLLKEFSLTFDQAEQLKKSPTKSKRLSRLDHLWSPLFEQLVGELQRSLAAPGTQHFPLTPHQLFLTGGGSHQHGLLRALRYGVEK